MPSARQVRHVFVDYMCLAQGERTAADKAEFGQMLANINLLYLGCRVLVLMDRTYMSRFWTSFEVRDAAAERVPAAAAAAATPQQSACVLPLLLPRRRDACAPSDCFRLRPIASDCVRLLPIASDCFRLRPIASRLRRGSR